ncbi:putative signal peptide protein [Puccinia sorghi]|uniref:Putative signal peptide protein n=1 Tax=Puccinia sorghi TaxID=27349 RepID=A0A0L6UCD6_9BASI|nr:putative signal peptide protein [Puccinia sorghi]
MWSLNGSLAGACCMSTAGGLASFFCSDSARIKFDN